MKKLFVKSFKENNTYLFVDIENYANEHNYQITIYGNNAMGEQFIMLKNERDLVHSFVLNGATSNSYIYKCIYTDIEF